jgi:hypothetical protein
LQYDNILNKRCVGYAQSIALSAVRGKTNEGAASGSVTVRSSYILYKLHDTALFSVVARYVSIFTVQCSESAE